MKKTNLIFHFSENLDDLKENIKSSCFYPEFKTRYIKYRKAENNKDHYSYEYYPMINFYNISLSAIEHLSSNHGNYAIVLSKKYAIKKKITPVIYAAPESPLLMFMYHIIHDAYTTFDTSFETMNRGLFIEPFVKNNFAAVLNNKIIKDYNNEIEHEYIYVPKLKITDKKDEYIKYFPKNQNNKKSIDKANKKIKKFKLKFKAKDIKYLLLNELNEVNPFIEFLKRYYNKNQISELLPKIITQEQLKADF